MNNKILGIILIIFGAMLMVWGYNIYDSASAQITRSITGGVPMQAIVGMLGGFINIVVGISKVK